MGELARRVGFVGRSNVLRSPRLRPAGRGAALTSPAGPCAAMGPPLDRVRVAPAVAAASRAAPRPERTREIQALPEARPAGRLESAARLEQSLVDDVNGFRRVKGSLRSPSPPRSLPLPASTAARWPSAATSATRPRTARRSRCGSSGSTAPPRHQGRGREHPLGVACADG
jgi:hypothetical protein